MAIPSLTALKAGIVERVYLQELDIESLLAMQRIIFAENSLQTSPPSFNQVPLKWGAMPKDFLAAHPPESIKLFIAADCLYERNGTSPTLY